MSDYDFWGHSELVERACELQNKIEADELQYWGERELIEFIENLEN